MRLSENYFYAPSDKAYVTIVLIRMSWMVALMITMLLMFPGVSGKFDPYVDNGGTLVGQYRILSSPSSFISLSLSLLLLLSSLFCSALASCTEYHTHLQCLSSQNRTERYELV